ncbi:MAG: hypothetical protein ABH812_01495 [bacterium]
MRSIKNSRQFIKGLQEWFDPAYESHSALRATWDKGNGVKITIDGIAKKAVWIIK